MAVPWRLQVGEAAGGVARFSFAELCDANKGAADYSAIAQHFHTVFLSGIPMMSLQVHPHSPSPHHTPSGTSRLSFSTKATSSLDRKGPPHHAPSKTSLSLISTKMTSNLDRKGCSPSCLFRSLPSPRYRHRSWSG